MLQTLTSGQISVTIDGHLGSVQTRDGSFIISGSARVLAYSTTSGQAGAALNVRGTNQVDVHTRQIAVPFNIVPGDSFVITSSATGGRESYFAANGRSAIDEMLAVVVVPYAVSQGLLRPPAIGDGFIPRLLRQSPMLESVVDVGRLPSTVDVRTLGIDWSAWGAGEPTIPYLTNLLQRFCGECYDGWSTDTRTPDWQHPGYGTFNAAIVSQALVQLCSTATPAEKLPLALAVVQRGIDLVGAFIDGRVNYPLGGHMAGRKALIVMTGHLLGIQAIADPSATVGNVFQEDVCYAPQQWWFGSDWTAGWKFNTAQSKLNQHPSTWGVVNAPQHDTFAWQVAGYMSQVVGAQIGTALAMRLIGRVREMGVHFDAMISQFMRGPDSSARQALDAAGISIPWGLDYSVDRGVGFCAASWKKHASSVL